MKEQGIVVNQGMGGFLNPPGHPEHHWSVQTDLSRRPWNRGGMSLSSAVDSEWLDEGTKAAAQRKLDSWQPLPPEDESVLDWIAQVLGYFANCYRGDGEEPECWHVSNLKIQPGACDLNEHAGVHLIQRYYPQYKPNCEDFERAYWGKKKTATA